MDAQSGSDYSIAVIGLGYVGLPLAIEFAKKYSTIGFDINKERINELLSGIDVTKEISKPTLKKTSLSFTTNQDKIKDCNIYIVTVPTPVSKNHKPILEPLLSASMMLAEYLSKNDIVIYESTVYPGCTEEECIPILEKYSGLEYNKDFYCGYSPERINPGDTKHTIVNIKKITSGSNQKTSAIVDSLYKSILKADTYMAPSIKVAEAAKVIENSQRDINIAFVNELAKIFNKLDIDTNEVLKAASTKWNFLPFKPGLVGGHCIGVDPYYLAQKAQEIGYHPEIILSGRRLNDSMGEYVGNEVVRMMLNRNVNIENANILILGITFKENCPDIRNSKVIEIYEVLNRYSMKIDVYDPIANPEHVSNEFDIALVEDLNQKVYDCIVLATAHDEFIDIDYKTISNDNTLIYDVKGVLNKEMVTKRL